MMKKSLVFLIFLIIQQVSYSQNDTLLTDKSPNFRIGYNSRLTFPTLPISILRGFDVSYKRHTIEFGIFYPEVFYIWNRQNRQENVYGHYFSYLHSFNSNLRRLKLNTKVMYATVKYGGGVGSYLLNYNTPSCSTINLYDCNLRHRHIYNNIYILFESQYCIFKDLLYVNLSIGSVVLISSTEYVYPINPKLGEVITDNTILPSISVGFKINLLNR
jgi:hypothetical protein